MKKKAILHNSLASLSNFAFTAITGIVLLPYYFNFIDKEQYGIWLGGISFLMIFSVFEANIALILTQKLGENWINNDKKKFSKSLYAALILSLLFTFIIIVTTFLLKETLAGWVSKSSIGINVFGWCFFIYAISLSLNIISSFLGAVSQVFLKTFYPPFFNVISSIFGVLFTVLTVSEHGVIAIALGALIKSFLYLILLGSYSVILLSNQKIVFSYDKQHIFALLEDIKWPFISKVGVTIAVNVQNFIIALVISASATTIFDVTRKFPFIIIMVVNMLTAATFTSFSLFYTENKNNEEENNKLTRVYFSLIRMLLFVALFCVFIFGKQTIGIWVGIDKFGGELLLGMLCVSALFDQLRLTLSQQYYALGKFKLTSVTDIIFSIGFIITLACLMPILKLYGLVLAGIAANLVYFMSCIYFEKKHSVNLIKQVVNKSLFIDLVSITFIGASAKMLIYHFDLTTIYKMGILIITFILFLIYLYIREHVIVKLLKEFVLKKMRK